MSTATHARPSRQRLPAYGRQLRAALDAGLRPLKGGGSIIVTTDWDYARAFHPGRVVCPVTSPPDCYDVEFLRGCEVIMLVHERDQLYGEVLFARIKDAGAKDATLSIVRESALC